MVDVVSFANTLKSINELGEAVDFVAEYFTKNFNSTHSIVLIWSSDENRVIFARWKGFESFPTFLFEKNSEKTGAVIAAIECGCLVLDNYSESSFRLPGEEFEDIGPVVAYAVPIIGSMYLSVSCGRKKDCPSFKSDEVEAIFIITNILANHVSRIVYQESVVRVHKGFYIILSGLERMLRGEDEAAVLSAIVQDMLEVFDAQYVVTFRYDPIQDVLVPVFWHGFVEILPLRPGEGVGGRAFKEKRPVLVADLSFELPRDDKVNIVFSSVLGSVISVPYYLDGRCIGVLCIARARYKPPFTNNELFLLQLIARLLEAILSYNKVRKEEEEKAKIISRLQKMEALGLLASGIAHDFNNILNGIVGLAEILRIKLEDGELKKLADMIVDQVKHGASLTKQLLDFSRRSQAEMAPIDLVVFLKEFVKFITRLFPSSIKVKTTIIPKTAVIIGDINLLHQALLNICINAKDAMPKGGELTVNLLVDDQRGEYIIEVIDTGCGMSKDVLERCLDPFFTTKGGFGTGLGLPQAYGIIEKHKGRLEIESEEGKGTKVTIKLPMYKNVIPTTGVVKEEVTLPRGNGETVLVVDDDISSLLVLKGMLELLGYSVVTARNGLEALDILKVKKPDIVITDVVMPEMDGLTLANNVREMYKNIPVIVVSGYSFERSMNGFVFKGFYALQKPVSLKELAFKVREALSNFMGAG